MTVELIKQAIESAKCRIYKLNFDLEGNLSAHHQKKANNQKELMEITVEALEKQIPKKPIVKPTTKEKPITHNLGRLLEVCCPVCGKRIFAIYETDLERGGGLSRKAKGCSSCLQAIDFTGYYATPKLDKVDEDIDWEEGGC